MAKYEPRITQDKAKYWAVGSSLIWLVVLNIFKNISQLGLLFNLIVPNIWKNKIHVPNHQQDFSDYIYIYTGFYGLYSYTPPCSKVAPLPFRSEPRTQGPLGHVGITFRLGMVWSQDGPGCTQHLGDLSEDLQGVHSSIIHGFWSSPICKG